MAQSDVFKRMLDAGVQFTQLTQQRAEGIVRDLVRTGEVQAEQAQTFAVELIERSRKNSEELLERVRTEVRNQVAILDLVTKDVVARLEQQIEAVREQVSEVAGRAGAGPVSKRLGSRSGAAARTTSAAGAAATGAAKPAPAKQGAATGTAKKSTAKKSTATKSTATKSTATKTATKRAGAPAKQPAAKQSPAKKSAVKQSPAKKSVAKGSPAKKAAATRSAG